MKLYCGFEEITPPFLVEKKTRNLISVEDKTEIMSDKKAVDKNGKPLNDAQLLLRKAAAIYKEWRAREPQANKITAKEQSYLKQLAYKKAAEELGLTHYGQNVDKTPPDPFQTMIRKVGRETRKAFLKYKPNHPVNARIVSKAAEKAVLQTLYPPKKKD
jgi:hypothetical protein